MGNSTHLKILALRLHHTCAWYLSFVHTSVKGRVTEKERGGPRANTNNGITDLVSNYSANDMHAPYYWKNELKQI